MRKVLIVDDQKDFLDIISLLMHRGGFETYLASSGVEAWGFLQHNTVDLVISDLSMPEGDGTWLLKEIKKSMPKLPVIIISNAVDVVEAEMTKLGASGFMGKNDFIKQIESIIFGLKIFS